MSSRSTNKQYDWSDVSPSIAVVETVADIEGSTVESLPPLTNAIDVDALDSLLDGSGTGNAEDVVVSIQYNGHAVSISSSGRLSIDG